MASYRRVLYIGITSHIEIRVRQHKRRAFGGFTAKYNVTNLVYFERYGSVGKAIRREKELKSWRREKKIELVESSNPKWRDLSYGWYQVVGSKLQSLPDCGECLRPPNSLIRGDQRNAFNQSRCADDAIGRVVRIGFRKPDGADAHASRHGQNNKPGFDLS
jgi:putative endonuclease